MPDIDIRKDHEHYIIYVNGEFHCTADDMIEVRKEIAEIEGGQEDE